MKALIALCVLAAAIPATAAQTLDPGPRAPLAELREGSAQLRAMARQAAREQLEALEGLAARTQQMLRDGRLEQRLERSLEQMQRQLQQQAQRLQRTPQAQRPERPARPPRPARGNGGRGPEVTETFSRTVRLGSNGTFDLSNVSGEVVITGGSGDDVRIEAVKRVNSGGGEAAARAALRELEIQVNERSGLVEVRSELPRRRNLSAAVDFTVTVPAGSNVSVKTVSGDIRVSRIKGDLRAESISGDVTLSGVERLRAAKSVSGDIDIADAAGEDVTAGTVSGDLVVRKLRSRGVEAESVSGSVRISEAEAERVTLRSISGDIDYEGRLARSGRYDIQSHSGNIRVTPAGNPGFDIEASTFSGDVRSDYALTLRGGASGNALAGTGRPRLNRTMRGAFGDASSILSLRSFSGDIVVVKK